MELFWNIPIVELQVYLGLNLLKINFGGSILVLECLSVPILD